MLTVLALAMIILFIVLLSMKKLSVFTSLTLVPFVFGIIAILVTDSSISDLFTWIQEGVFFSVDPETAKASWGVISPAMTILFSILYFDIMLGVGLFDPVAEFFIKKAKGDPLKVILSTVMVASVVAFNGDTTTTIIICLHFRLYQFVPPDESEAELSGHCDCGSHRNLEHAPLGRPHHRFRYSSGR